MRKLRQSAIGNRQSASGMQGSKALRTDSGFRIPGSPDAPGISFFRTQYRRGSRGVTFLEIMVVIVVLGILLAIAMPNMRGPAERAALRGAARDIAAAGLLARQRAIVQGEATYLYISEEEDQWQLRITPKPEDLSDRNDWEDGEVFTNEERLRTLPERVTFKAVETEMEDRDDDDRWVLTFFPNGSSSGLAVQIATKRREQTLTVDFDQGTGRPEVYKGEPKSFAQKLQDQGIDPALYGLVPENEEIDTTTRTGEGFKRTAGMTEDERVEFYKDAVDRMLKRSRNRYYSQFEGGPAAHYAGAQQWGGGNR